MVELQSVKLPNNSKNEEVGIDREVEVLREVRGSLKDWADGWVGLFKLDA